jgi:hypothetical protein
LEREHAKGKNIVGGKENFLTKTWAHLITPHCAN